MGSERVGSISGSIRLNRIGGMPCVQINGVERVAQMPFGIVIEAAAVEPFVTVGDGPFDDVVKDAIALMATFIANRFWGDGTSGTLHGSEFVLRAPGTGRWLFARRMARPEGPGGEASPITPLACGL